LSLDEYKLAAGAILLLILSGAIYFGLRSVYSAGVTDGKAVVQTAWDADKASIQKVTDAAIAQATAQRDMALQANEVIANDYQTKLSAANANAAALLASVRAYEARAAANRGALPKAGGGQPTADPSQVPPSKDGLDQFLERYDVACQSDAAQLNALIAELKPQL
jgi:hypothetical protein